jgi:multidrug efflux system outer membrane protein
MNRYFLLIIISGLFLGQSCVVGPKYTRVNLNIPSSFRVEADADTAQMIKWFELYQDTALRYIIKTTLENNKDLAVAAVRIEEAAIEAAIIKINQNPRFEYEIEAGGGVAGKEAQKATIEVNGSVLKTAGMFNWELDIWGRLRRYTAAARLQFLASKENSNALKVSLVSQAASLYFSLRDLDNRLFITERTLKSRQESTKIITEKFEKGYISELDKLQAIQEEAIAASFIPSLQRQIAQTENELSILMGVPPGKVQRGVPIFEQILPPEIPVGVPSLLLQRRPDVKESENLLQAQFEHIGIAEANRYPNFSLTGTLGFASPRLNTLVKDGVITNGYGSLTGPVFQFGQNKKKVELEKQKTKEYQLQFEKTFLNALADVNNALIQTKTFSEEFSKRKEQVDAARKALMLSNARYNSGYTSYLEVLTQANSLFDAELLESQLYQQKLNATVLLYKALGGGWN